MRKIFTKRRLLFIILAFSLATRLWRVWIPDSYYFDEVYHALTAGAYAQNDPRGYEWWHTSAVEGTAYEWLHPPVAKLIQGFSIWSLGDNSFAWRLPSVIFGVLVVWAVYFYSMKLTRNKSVALLAALLASLDGLLLVMSRIAMNDIFVTFFMVMALGFYWKFVSEKNESKNLWLAGLFVGLAVSTKWSGVFVLGVVGSWEVIRMIVARKFFWRRAGRLIVAFLLLPAAIYVLSYGQFWLQGHSVEQFVELHRQIRWYQTNLEANHAFESTPFDWVLNLRPVWFYVEYQENSLGNIYALSNPGVAVLGLAAMVWTGLYVVLVRSARFLYLVLCYLWVWVVWLLAPRIMFFYHYTPAIPFLAVAMSVVFWSLWEKKWGRVVGISGVLVTGLLFVYFYPHWSGIVLPRSFVERYFWLESWR